MDATDNELCIEYWREKPPLLCYLGACKCLWSVKGFEDEVLEKVLPLKFITT